jgi:hypothetical protein
MLWRGGECVDEVVAEAADDANAAAAGDDDNNNQNLTAPSVLPQHLSHPPSRQQPSLFRFTIMSNAMISAGVPRDKMFTHAGPRRQTITQKSSFSFIYSHLNEN